MNLDDLFSPPKFDLAHVCSKIEQISKERLLVPSISGIRETSVRSYDVEYYFINCSNQSESFDFTKSFQIFLHTNTFNSIESFFATYNICTKVSLAHVTSVLFVVVLKIYIICGANSLCSDACNKMHHGTSRIYTCI